MDKRYEREHLFYRILCGYELCEFNNELLKVYSPSPDIRLQSYQVHQYFLKYAELSGLFSFKDILSMQVKSGLWNDALEKEHKGLPKSIENLKVELYKSFQQLKKRDNIRKIIHTTKRRYQELERQRTQLRHTTAEGVADYECNKFLICSSTYTMDGKRRWMEKSFLKEDESKLNYFINDFLSRSITEDEIRDLVQNDPFKSAWTCAKCEQGVFGKPSCNLTENQSNLLVWARIYDSVYESMDCPSEDIIEDNDLLDGWLITQNRNREEERKRKQYGDNKNDKHKNADEVFVFVDNPEDVDKVNYMNTQDGLMRKRQRMSAIKNAKDGQIKDQHLPDSRNQIKQQAMDQYRETMRGMQRR